MNIISKSIASMLAISACISTATAETFPIFSDTSGSPVTGKILKINNSAKTLNISPKSTVYLDFKANFSGIAPQHVTGARLTLYLARVTKPGSLNVGVLSSGFDEAFTAASAPNPSNGTPVGSVPITAALNRDFIVIDVTNEVKAWLTNPASEFGFSLASDGTLACTIASKEGAGSGHPAVLEVDAYGGQISGTAGTFTDSVSVGGLQMGQSFLYRPFGGGNSLSSTPFSIVTERGNIILNAGTNGSAGGTVLLDGIAQVLGDSSSAILDLAPFDPGPGNDPATRIEGRDDGGFGGHLDFFTKPTGSAQNGLQRRMRITNDGNVGIGTTTPGAKLDVAGIGMMHALELRGVANAYLDFSADDSGADFGARIIYPGLSDNRLLFQGAPVTFESRVTVSRGNTSLEVIPGSLFGVANSNAVTLDMPGLNGSVGVWDDLVVSSQAFKPGGGSWAALSDIRLKKNVNDLHGALDHLLRLRSVTFEYNEPEKIGEPAGVRTGFIAQEVETVFPDWVGTKTDGFKYVSPTGFESLTVQAIRELRAEKDAEIAKLRAENAALKQQLAENDTRDKALEARLARLEGVGSSVSNADVSPKSATAQ